MPLNPTNTDNDNREGDSLVPQLPNDGATPFSQPADDSQSGRLDDSHQATDAATDIDSHQLYDEGLAAASGAEEPNAGNTVTGYDPESDSRRQNG